MHDSTNTLAERIVSPKSEKQNIKDQRKGHHLENAPARSAGTEEGRSGRPGTSVDGAEALLRGALGG